MPINLHLYNIKAMSKFQLDGQRFLLTWPKSDQYTPQIIWKHIKDLFTHVPEYAVICQEVHKDGLNHHHAVIIYNKRIRMKANPFGFIDAKCNVKYLKYQKDVIKAIKYVKKDGNYIEKGEIPDYARKMDKREKIFYCLSHTDIECIDSGQYSFSELTKLQAIRNMWYCEWPQFKPRTVEWYYGGTGTGKTRMAWETLLSKYQLHDIWCSSGKLDPFFIGYTNQRGVILDDLRPGSIRFELLLRILDGYPVHVNVKGSHAMWLAEHIIITAPVQPGEMYVNRETGQEWDHLDQLLRRIGEVRQFGELTTPTQFISD